MLVYPEGRVVELGRGYDKTTNNRMELTAVIDGINALESEEVPLWVLTDSTYVIRGITQWIWGWKKKGWKTASGSPVTNRDLWEALDQAVRTREKLGEIEWKYVRGHTGVPGNERCDEIAVGFTKKKWVELYDGDLLQYSIAIHDIPTDLSLPAMREKKEKKAAHSYLSYVNGQLKRHSTWKECEAVVKGRPGAKFLSLIHI